MKAFTINTLKQYKSFEIEPVIENKAEGYCVTVSDQPESAHFWTVYGRNRDGLAYALVDCCTQGDARIVADAFEALIHTRPPY